MTAQIPVESPKNTVVPATTLDPLYTANQGGDQVANPCHDEVIGDITNHSEAVQAALQDTYYADSLPTGFPKFDMDNLGGFSQESNKLNNDIAAIENQANSATAKGDIGTTVVLTSIESQALEANGRMWDTFNSEQQRKQTN